MKANSASVDLSVPDDIKSSIKETGLSVIQQAKQLTISDDIQYAAAADFLTSVINVGISECNSAFDDNIRRWHEGHKSAIADKKRYSAPWTQAKEIVTQAMGAYQQERKRLKEEESRRLAESLKQDAEREAAEEAAELIAAGDDKAAEEILTSLAAGKVELAVAPPPMINTPLKVEGTSFRTLKRFQMLDESKLKREYLVPDEKLIQNEVNKSGYDAERIVGEGSIRVYDKPSIGSRR